MSDPYESVIGLEVHVQLATRSKLFCGCESRFGAPPNTHVCPVCTGQPGVLPVLNEEALRLGALAGLALDCRVAGSIRFDRKNYFYPDLPKGYQISQLHQPLNVDGHLTVESDEGEPRRVAIVRAHLEEDAGKSTHPAGADHTLVDLNRAGVPLLEIVSGPDLRSPEEAHRYLVELKRRLRYASVSDCDMEKGSIRCDANVSIRPRGSEELLERTEIKNLNSFKNVQRALAYEIGRQTSLVDSGGEVVQETRTWLEDESRTEVMRTKEDAHDYRYFPEPDLAPFVIDDARIEELRGELPEMPRAKRRRYEQELGLPAATAEVLVAEPEHADWFEACLAASADLPPKQVANYFTGAILKEVNERAVTLDELRITPVALCEVLAMVEAEVLSTQAAKKVLAELAEHGGEAAEVVKKLGLAQISDPDELGGIIDQVLAEKEAAVQEYRDGNKNILNALLGAVMKASGGKANPNLTRSLLEERLAG